MSTYEVVPSDAELRGALRAADFDEGCLSIRDAARLAGVGRTSLYKAIAADDLRTVKVGRRRLVPRKALLRWLARSAG